MKKSLISLLLIFSFSVSAAYADCNYNGQVYPVGTRVGPYICKPDGSWGR